MKKIIVLTLLACTLLMGQITGTAHDFSVETWNSAGEICNVCHTPHNADTGVTGSPLWNHDVTITTFTLYSTSTLNATVGQPDGVSKLCLSCHDGTVALDSFGGAAGSAMIATDKELGIDIGNDHPISFTYDATLAIADGWLFNPSLANSGLGGTIEDDLLSSGKVECSSCHDVHNGLNIVNLLVKSNSTSALCLTCHNK